MEIIQYDTDYQGCLHFFVASALYPRIFAHLQEKQLNPGGTRRPNQDESEIIIAASIEAVNSALADFKP
ncbi:MAG: hypothetical protein ABSE48_15495 [Verrucomicrobiota bacterium]|jgi:hypothetical protein